MQKLILFLLPFSQLLNADTLTEIVCSLTILNQTYVISDSELNILDEIKATREQIQAHAPDELTQAKIDDYVTKVHTERAAAKKAFQDSLKIWKRSDGTSATSTSVPTHNIQNSNADPGKLYQELVGKLKERENKKLMAEMPLLTIEKEEIVVWKKIG